MRKQLAILSLTIIVLCSTVQGLQKNLYKLGDLPMLYADKDPTDFAKFISFIWRLVEILCVLLLLADVIMRANGKALYFIHASRYIIFSFAASGCIMGGYKYVYLGTRYYMTIHLYNFYRRMYRNVLGWTFTESVELFTPPTPKSIMFINATFWEHLILLTSLIIWGSTKLILRKTAMMSKVYHIFKSLFLVLFISFMLPMLYYCSVFWGQHITLGKDQPEVSRSYFGYVFQWIIMIFWTAIGLCFLWSMIKTALDPLDGDKRIAANFEQPDFTRERNELIDAENTMGLGKDCSTESVSHDFTYMHQDKVMLTSKPLGKWYNFAFTTRWCGFFFICLMGYYKPRSAYTILVVVDLFMVVFTIMCRKSFMNICGILIIVEEICVLLWHFIIWMFFVDSPKNGFEKGTVKFWSYVMFVCYILCMLIEIVLLILGGKLCFKTRISDGKVYQAPLKTENKKLQSSERKHIVVELPEHAKLKTGSRFGKLPPINKPTAHRQA